MNNKTTNHGYVRIVHAEVIYNCGRNKTCYGKHVKTYDKGKAMAGREEYETLRNDSQSSEWKLSGTISSSLVSIIPTTKLCHLPADLS